VVGAHNRRVLMIEDDLRIAQFVEQGLIESGFEVRLSANGLEGLELIKQGDYCAVILDVMLPGMDGIEVLRQVRELRISIPVLILSAKISLNDRLLGLKTGGDDYLVKPFAFAELLARLECLLRRSQGVQEPLQLRAYDLTLDLMKRCALRGRETIMLHALEFNLLELLMRNAGRIVSRAEILKQVWGYNFSPSTNVIEVHICRLREKIERPGSPKLLRTIRGAGYVLADHDQTFEQPVDPLGSLVR
jgi:two-component system OmpR family response regulator